MFGYTDYKWRRRVLVTSIISLLVVLLTTYFIISSVLSVTSEDDARVFELGRDFSGDPAAAFGLNLERVNSGNLLSYGGFEPEVLQSQFLAAEGTKNSFVIPTVSVHDSLRTSADYYEGADIRIYSQSQENYQLRVETKVKEFTAGQLQNFRQILLPPDTPTDLSFYEVAEYDKLIMLCGDNGYVLEITKEGETKLHNVGTSAKLVSIAGSASGWVAVADDGSYYLSADGQDWTQDSIEKVSFNDVITISSDGRSNFLACADKGKLYRISFSETELIPLNLDSNLNSLCRLDEKIVIAGDEGLLMSGSLELDFEIIKDMPSSIDWLSINANTEGFVCCGTKGGMAYSRDGDNFQTIDPHTLAAVYGIDPEEKQSTHKSIIWPTLANCTFLADQNVLFQAMTGQSWLSEAPGRELITSPYFDKKKVDFIASLSSGRILAVYEDSSLEMATLSDVVTFEPALDNGEVQSGDLIILEKVSFPPAYGWPGNNPEEQSIEAEPSAKGEAIPGIWYVSDGARLSLEKVAAHSPQELGQGCIKLTNDFNVDQSDQNLLLPAQGKAINSIYNSMPAWLNARVAQKLDLSRGEGLNESFYSLELYLRQVGLENNSVVVWLSGLHTDASHTVEKLGNSWEKHRFIFVLGQQSPDSEIWLNIGFAGRGALWLDQIWFGPTENEPSSLPRNLLEQLSEIKPGVVRLGFVPIGVPGLGDHSWILPEGTGARMSAFVSEEKNQTRDSVAQQGDRELHNLGAAFKMTQQIGADPWLVVDAMVSDLELLHLIEYLAGDATTDFGQLRSTHGAVGRWSDQMNRIYIEISDSTNMFTNDTSRMIYVDHVIETIQSAADYAQLEKKLVIVDGMDYDGQVLASNADYHAGSLSGSDIVRNYGEMSATLTDFLREMPTRRVLGGGSKAPEMIKSFYWQERGNNLRLADYAALIFGEAGKGINLVLIDGDKLDSPAPVKMDSALQLVGRAISDKWALPTATELFTADMTTDKLTDDLTAETVTDPGATKDLSTIQGGDGLNAESEELLLFSFIANDLRTVIMLNLGQNNISLRLGGSYPIANGSLYSFDERANLLSNSKIKSSSHIYRVLPGGMLLLVEKKLGDE